MVRSSGWNIRAFLVGFSFIFAAAIPSYAASATPVEVPRDTLNAYLEYLRLRSVMQHDTVATPEAADAVAARIARLVRSFRFTDGQGVGPVREAPYIGFLIAEKVNDIYPRVYDSTWKDKYKENVTDLTLEKLLDMFLLLIESGQVEKLPLPEKIKEAADSIGAKVAKRVRAAGASDAPEKCELDLSEDPKDVDETEPGLCQKLEYWFGLMGACTERKFVFYFAKRSLIDALHDPKTKDMVGEYLGQIFPAEFRKGFLETLNGYTADVSKLVAAKFQGSVDDAWNAPLVESELTESGLGSNLTPVRLRGFAAGLRADIGAASRLVRSTSPADRGLGAALLYAAGNRLLVTMGRSQALWDGKKFVVADDSSKDPSQDPSKDPPKDPKQAPRFSLVRFGGLSATVDSSGAYSFPVWDWENYLKKGVPAPFQLYPSQFLLDRWATPRQVPDGEPVVETMEDLAELARGALDMLRETREGATFAKNFAVTEDDMANVIKTDSPVLFPSVGRKLAFAALASVLRNLIEPVQSTPAGPVGGGHIQETNTGLHLAFNDRIGLAYDAQFKTLPTHLAGPARLQGVARALLAANDLLDSLDTKDPELNDLADFRQQIVNGVQQGTLLLHARWQDGDGGFRDFDAPPAPPPLGRRLLDTVLGLRALTRAYNASHVGLLEISIRASWEYLHRFWTENDVIPAANESGAANGLVDDATAWELLSLWEESQPAVAYQLSRMDKDPNYAELNKNVHWDAWTQRMEALRALMNSR